MRMALSQTLTPQQIQYLKLLQLPVMQLEQQVRQEIEQNPMLEESSSDDTLMISESEFDDEQYQPTDEHIHEIKDGVDFDEEYQSPKSMIDDEGDPFEFYKLVWQDSEDTAGKTRANYSDDEDSEPYQIRYHTSFIEDLLAQFRLLHLSEEQYLLGEQIIGNLDDDGYLRRDLQDIVYETNERIAEINHEHRSELSKLASEGNETVNPAKMFAVSSNLLALMDIKDTLTNDDKADSNIIEENSSGQPALEYNELREVGLADAETVLSHIQRLDPPGVASRTIQECLLAQCRIIRKPNAAQKLATEILEKAYDAFVMKHYNVILKQFEVSEEYLRQALDVIRRLNPKPGGREYQSEINAVTPDFIIERDDKDDLIISVNDARIPALKLNKAYEKLKREARFKHFNKDTRDWIRNKYEEAKFLIQAIRQRKNTMLKVMTAIAGLQKEFFFDGPSSLKPLIYKDVSENTGLDISTVCRIVNGKYVQTDFGNFELKYFFSESLPNEDGEEVSTTVIKQIIKEIVDTEPKGKPFSDEKIGKELKKRGYNVARRTVAKYRELLRIPVARLRKEL
jgi:RNA polymerase sigma-54 factor